MVDIGEHQRGPVAASGVGLLADAVPAYECDIEQIGDSQVGVADDDDLPLRRTRSDQWPYDVEEFALEAHVMHASGIEIPAGLRVSNDGVVFPRIPQPPRHVDDVPHFGGGLGADLGSDSRVSVRAVVDTDHPGPAAVRGVVHTRELCCEKERFGRQSVDRGSQAEGGRGGGDECRTSTCIEALA